MNQKSISRGNPIASIGFPTLKIIIASFVLFSCSDNGTESPTMKGNQSTPPTITSVVPDSAHVGDVISILGSGFSASTGISNVTVDGAIATPTLWTDSLIMTTIPTSAANGEIRVIINGASSNMKPVRILSGSSLQMPLLMSISPDSIAVGGTVTLNGDFVWDTQGSGQVLCQSIPAVIQSWTSSQITFTAPDWIGVTNVVVRVGGRSSNALSLRIYSSSALPFISSITPTSGMPGDVVTIDGTGLGSASGSVTINGVAAAVGTWTQTRVAAIVPSAATSGHLVVHTPHGSSNGLPFTLLPNLPPSITSLSPDSGTVGTTVTINGSAFGEQQGTSFVTFGGIVATVTGWSAGEIATRVPGGATTGNVVVTVNGTPSNAINFRVLAASGSIPTITEVDPNPSDVGERIRIHGTNFGPETPVVKINEVTVALDEWRSDEIRFYVPSHAVTGNLVVTVGGRSSSPVWFVINGTVPGGMLLSTTSVSIQVGSTTDVTISGGVQPYTIQTTPNAGVATASLVASAITVNGISNGSTTLVVRDNTSPTPSTATLSIDVYTPSAGVSFSQHIQPIFSANCTGCHGGSGGLTLTAGQSYNNLVDVQAQAECTTENRVSPGNAASSVLYKRVSGTSCGERMPRGGNPLSAADIQSIMDWINQGALNN